MKLGEEREIGCANGWRYMIERSEAGGLFWVKRKSMSLEDHGQRCQSLTVRMTEEEAERVAWEYIRRAHRVPCSDF